MEQKGGSDLRKRVFLLLAFSIAIFSWAPFSKGLMKQVDLSADFRKVQKARENYIGKRILLGGWILQTLNRQDESEMRVIQNELDFQKKPISLDQSSGRFIIRFKGFLDSVIYREGREVTVLGNGGERSPFRGKDFCQIPSLYL
jgi:starvation-inducible outer membrane lipoprotein